MVITMKRTLRRIASLLCALSLCLTLLPGMARAEDPSPLPEEPAAIECICQVPCTEDAVNPECPLCSLEGADLTLCLGVVPETPAEEPTEPEAPAEEPVDEIPAEESTEPEIPVEEPEEDVGNTENTAEPSSCEIAKNDASYETTDNGSETCGGIESRFVKCCKSKFAFQKRNNRGWKRDSPSKNYGTHH